MPLSIVIKFHEDQIKGVWFRERKHLAVRPQAQPPRVFT